MDFSIYNNNIICSGDVEVHLKLLFIKEVLRKGDSLLQFLFILVLKVLFGIKFKGETKGDIHMVKLTKKGPPISHLMFIDSVIIFVRENIREAETLWNILHSYVSWSRQKN